MRNIEKEVAQWRKRLESAGGIWDESMLSRARGGDADAARRLIERFHGKIAKIIDARLRRVPVNDKEDLFQEALVQVYDGIRNPVSNADSEAAFVRWLVLVVTRVLADWLKREADRRQSDDTYGEHLDLLVSSSEGFDDPLDGFEMTEFLDRAISLLQERDRKFMRLYLAGHNRKEIAEKLGMNLGYASRRWQQILKNLKHSLGM